MVVGSSPVAVTFSNCLTRSLTFIHFVHVSKIFLSTPPLDIWHSRVYVWVRVWKVLSQVTGLTKKGFSSLCLTEKLWLIQYLDDVNLLNKKSELISKCRHANKLMISSVKDKQNLMLSIYRNC